ncbi:MAG TPA: ANTAR domain-containing protein [Candidatus Limiplasma sp.]|nr:ANTAR domain-containing protein [Candidatus Limiplasma sp.]
MTQERNLLVAARGQEKLMEWLNAMNIGDVEPVAGAAQARRKASGDSYSLALINAPLLDESGLELAVDLAQNTTAAVVLLVKTEMAAMIADTAMSAGVLVVTKPVNQLLFEQTVKVGISCRNRLLIYKNQTERLQTRYEELKVIDRAKCLLIEHMRITEEEAHRVLEKEAMDSRMSRVRVARKVLDRFEL